MSENARACALNAKKASIALMGADKERKNKALEKVARALENNKDAIIKANESDMEKARESDLALPLVKRLVFDESKIDSVVQGIRDLINLPDPIGKTTYKSRLDEGLDLYRVTCPIGVIGVIFESRPDALVQISSLCLKSGNAVILKGGSEANSTNKILTEIISKASIEGGMPEGWISLMLTRDDVKELLEMENEVDLIIPRGSNSFVKMIMDNTSIPVLGHADGICHVYVDKDADEKTAVQVVHDAKTQYAAACNAAETVLINKERSNDLLPLIYEKFRKEGVEVFGCDETCRITGCEKTDDWHREYLDLKVSVKIVSDLREAIEHINMYGSGHTDAIITENGQTAREFMAFVDSGNVFLNCSTRFSDGFRYGFGAEVGISTSKIHARGPVGLDGLVTYKYKLFGSGQKVSDYSNKGRTFIHQSPEEDCPFDK